MKSTKHSYDGKFKIGDKVKPIHYSVKEPSFIVKDIVTDGYGSVLLKEKGGFGFGSYLCEKVEK